MEGASGQPWFHIKQERNTKNEIVFIKLPKMSNVLFALLCIVASLLLFFYYKVKKIYETWSSRGIPHEKPVFFFGNSWRTLFRYTSQGERLKEVCDQFPDAPFIGFYDFLRPQLLVKDSEIIEKILIKDFQHFVDHGFILDEEKNPLDISLFNMTGKKWKAFRNKLVPCFTTGKLKILFEQMNGISENMDKLFDKENMTGVELRDVMGRFAMDVISSFAFGFDAGNLMNPDSEFRRMGKKSFELSTIQLLKFFLITAFPDVSKKLGVGFTQADVQNYFVNIIRETVDYRKKNKVRRNDFVDLMIQIKEKGSVEITTKDPGDDYLGIDESYVTDSFDLTEDLIVGTAFVFLTAGFEATATSMTWACLEIAQNDEIQDRLHNEIVQKVKEHGGLNFNAVKDMDYLEMTLKETLRKYPPAQALFRICTKEYTLPGGQTVKTGDTVMVPLLSVHHCPEYYPEPSKFDPERFGPDASLKPCVFLPFGDGPRVCIAMRFAMLQIKFGLAKILMSHKVKLNPKTKLPIVTDKKTFFTAPNDPIYFDLTKI